MPCEVVKSSKGIKIITELPGAFEGSININANGNQVEIDAQSERRSYYESINVPAEAD